MKAFEIQLKNANHPTGKYRRDGELFAVGAKYYAEKISAMIFGDKHLKVRIVEDKKDVIVKGLKDKLGTEPFVKISASGEPVLPEIETDPKKKDEKPKEEKKQAGPGFFGKITGKGPVQAIPPVPELPEKKD
jgi:hypothetical protein